MEGIGSDNSNNGVPSIDMSQIDDIVDDGAVVEATTLESALAGDAGEGSPQPEDEPQGSSSTPKTTFDPPNDDLLDGGEAGTTDGAESSTSGEDPVASGDEDPEAEEDTSPEATFYKGVVDILKKKDFFQQEDLGEVKTEEDLAKVLDKEIEARLSDKYKELNELAKTGAPVDKVVQISQGLEQLNQISEDTIAEHPEMAQQLIIEEFLHKGFSQEDAVKYYSLIEQAGNATDEAMKALDARKGQFKAAIVKLKTDAKEAAEAEALAKQEELKALEKAFEAEKILGRQVGPATREKLKKMVMTPVAYTKTGQPINELMKYKMDNPVDFEQKLSYLFLVTNGFSDLKAFDRSAETRVSRSLKAAVNVLSTDGGPISNAQSKGKNVIDLNSIDDIV